MLTLNTQNTKARGTLRAFCLGASLLALAGCQSLSNRSTAPHPATNRPVPQASPQAVQPGNALVQKQAPSPGSKLPNVRGGTLATSKGDEEGARLAHQACNRGRAVQGLPDHKKAHVFQTLCNDAVCKVKTYRFTCTPI